MRETDHEPPTTDTGEPQAGHEENDSPTTFDAHADEGVTEASEDSFPASDAPPWNSSVT